MATYQEEIARWRQERRQQEANSRLQELRQEHAEAIRERDQAVASNELELAASADDQAQYLENEYRQLVGPQQPQVDPQWMNWMRRNAGFIEREGQRGVKAVTDALAYMQRPRNPNSNDPRYTGMGMTPQQVFSKPGLDKLEDLLETHGSQFYGVRFDKNEKTLTPNGAAKMSGLSPKQYNDAARQIGAQGRYSWQQGNK
jgi:hypothetical protein